MEVTRSDRTLPILLFLAAALFLFHLAINGQYGFHRDELATVEDAHHPAWGYVAYPPVTPMLGRLAMLLFGPSLLAMRVFPALAQAVVLVLAGLIARDLNGGRLAQTVAAIAVAVGPVALASGALLQYVAFDFLWWVLAAFFVARLLRTDDPRYLLGVGMAIGLGGLTKYTMLLLMVGILAGLALTPYRRYFKSKWFWIGAALAAVIVLPHLLWQVQNKFVSIDFLRHIHERDVRIGRTSGFVLDQFFVSTNLFTLPLWIAGLYFFFASSEGRRYRTLGWMFLVPMALFSLASARGYYTSPSYSWLLAGGAVVFEGGVAALRPVPQKLAVTLAFVVLAIGAGVVGAVALPLAPIGSPWFRFASANNGDFVEELGWPELAGEVARIRDSLPPADRAHFGILAANYGEAGALDMYGPSYGLPRPLSGINSYWARGYGDPPPQTLIVLGFSDHFRAANFASCELAGHTPDPYHVRNEETGDHPDIFVCRGLRQSWPEFWSDFRYFG